MVIAGLFAIVGIFALAVGEYDKASDVATAVGSVSGVIGALVGAYFGIRGTTVAQAQAMEMMSAHLRPHGEPPPDKAQSATDPASSGSNDPPLQRNV